MKQNKFNFLKRREFKTQLGLPLFFFIFLLFIGNRRAENNLLGNLIGGFIVILVGTSLAPTVAQQVGTAQADGNVTGASDTLLGLTTLFYSLAIATSAIGIAALGLRNSGLM